ncbi:MAG: hypothetical protein RLZZ450_822 [Pseudomonadota bacterium]|jgi:hypothetical protein
MFAPVVRSWGALVFGSCVLWACERTPSVVVELTHDAALAPVVLAPPPPEPAGITMFDCTGTEPGQSAQSLRTWKSPGAAGAGTNLKGHALACDVTLKSDCAGQAELRVSAGLARSEKIVTAVAPGKPATVQLRLASGLWEKALEPEDRAPYQDTLQMVARAEVRCAAPLQEPRPRYWTDSFVAGLMGDRQKPAAPEPGEPAVAVKDEPAAGEGDGDSEAAPKPPAASTASKPAPQAAKPKPAATSATAASTASDRAAARAARRERKRNAAPEVDLNLHPPKPASAEEEPAAPDTEE